MYMITKPIIGISGDKTNSITAASIVPEPAVHYYGTYSAIGGNKPRTINGKRYNPIHRVTEQNGDKHIVESINPIDLQANRAVANGTITNKNGTVYAFRKIEDDELRDVRKAISPINDIL